MSGRPQTAKLAVGCPLDGGVRCPRWLRPRPLNKKLSAALWHSGRRRWRRPLFAVVHLARGLGWSWVSHPTLVSPVRTSRFREWLSKRSR